MLYHGPTRKLVDKLMTRRHVLGMTFLRLFAPALLAASCLTSTSAAQLPERKLGAPAARLEEPFSEILALRELRDGRVIVLDGKEQRIVVADLTNGRVTPIGAKGRGPGEFLRVLRFVSLPGDTTWAIDGQGGRVLVIGPNATPTGVVTQFPSPASDSGLNINTIRVADARGALYFVRTRTQPNPDTFTPPDSTRILQFDRARGAFAAFGVVALQSSRVTVHRSGQQITAVEVTRTPYSIGDEWDIGPGGHIAIARREPYRVEILTPGKPVVRGPVIPATTRKINDADKAEYIAGLPNASTVKKEALPWPEDMPVFLNRAVTVTDREVWVRRTGAAGAEVAQHDVFDFQGRRIANMPLPSSVRVLLVTARGVYVSRADEDGLQYVERYAMPR